ncbi:MAG: hypothetical protein QG639_1031 [Patescibacteria group bacterium]|nr:hypothetical protein [Patescibacteria group bacterium]
MKKIAVFFSSPEPMDYPLSSPDYWSVYSEIAQEISKKGGLFYVVRGQETYKGKGRFTQSWNFNGDSLKEAGEVIVDVIYDKGRFERDGTLPVLNCRKIQDICVDKWKMYTTFPEYCPTTVLVESAEHLAENLSQLTTDSVVFKPQSGAEGEGVLIQTKPSLVEQAAELTYPAVVSNFLDTADGIPGIMSGVHDLRVMLVDGEIAYCSYRVPPEGGLLANVAQGGELVVVEAKELPAEIVEITHEVDQRMAFCEHRFYCIDFGYTPGGPKIIEMNSEMGMMPNSYHPVFVTLKQKLADLLLSMA